jgi:hypothetical protein
MPGDTARENGKKGGRPRLEATVLREALIAAMEAKAKPLADALVDKALEGDVPALREVLDRGLGKPIQGVDHTTNGKDLPTPILGLVEKPKEE